ncbi:MAG: 23S rRNA (adenine(2503)-C(2))-methyltransferase RlmN [Phycisphaerae bacterium]
MTAVPKRHLLRETPDTLGAWLAAAGEPAYRAAQVFDWLYRRGATDVAAMSNLPRGLRDRLAAEFDIVTARDLRVASAADGTTKLLLAWPDGATSECVLIPDDDRRTACISSQVGCPVGCKFCASGLDGVERNLAAGEIVEQVQRIRRLCESPAADGDAATRLGNIVLMGSGEPLANYDEVLAALRIINAEWGPHIGARKITLSTVGLPKQIRRLADEGLQINLALSLHAPSDALRHELIPWAGKIPLDDILSACRHYFDRTGREITLEYILLGGVNDQPVHARQLARVAKQLRCNVNLIRYNPVAGLPYRRPESRDSQAFQSVLRQAGINAHLRRSRGLEIDAACGQLRRRERADPVVPLTLSAAPRDRA